MNRKSLALGMIIPLAAAGVVATAPAASANHNPTFSDSDPCNGLRERLKLTGEIKGPAGRHDHS